MLRPSKVDLETGVRACCACSIFCRYICICERACHFPALQAHIFNNATTMASTHPKSKVTILIVPGSFATPPLYDALVKAIRDQGYDAKAVDLLSANDGTRLPAPTTTDDAEHIRQHIISVLDDPTEPKDVVLALHSYSGVPGSSAVKGLSKADRSAQGKNTSVIGIAYLASFMMPLGISNRKFMIQHDAMPEGPFRDGVPGGYLPAIPADYLSLMMGEVESDNERRRLVNAWTLHSSDSFDGGVAYEAWKDIPSVTIIPEEDSIVPTQLQESMYQDALAAGGKVTRAFVKNAGHLLNVSRPDVVAIELVKLAQGN